MEARSKYLYVVPAWEKVFSNWAKGLAPATIRMCYISHRIRGTGYMVVEGTAKLRTGNPPDILLELFTELIPDEQSKKLIGEAVRIGAGQPSLSIDCQR